MDIKELEGKLDSFDKNIRLEALISLREKFNKGEIKQDRKTGFINLHCHTFFSFNAYGYSPAHIAWRSFREGLEVIGIIDFDTLDGMEEMFESGRILNMKTVTGIETRVFIEEYIDKAVASPGEPGIYYMMGTGFYKKPDAGSGADGILAKMGAIAEKRNLKILEKVHNFLQELKIDYEKDVLPLTPRRNATERHIVSAIDKKARTINGDNNEKIADFWSEKLQVNREKILSIVDKPAEMQELIRVKLMKQGAPGYVPPERENFPTLEEVIKMIEGTDALPLAGWLDGTSEGERNIEELLEFFIKKGTVVLNIVPDRNWNIKDKKEKEIKVKNLQEAIKTAKKLDLPVIAGTEMNKFGQKFVDDFTVPELSPYLEDFRKGAFFVYGHTQTARLFDKGYNSQWAKENFPSRRSRNNFYIKAGEIIQPDYNCEDWDRILTLL